MKRGKKIQKVEEKKIKVAEFTPVLEHNPVGCFCGLEGTTRNHYGPENELPPTVNVPVKLMEL